MFCRVEETGAIIFIFKNVGLGLGCVYIDTSTSPALSGLPVMYFCGGTAAVHIHTSMDYL